MSTKRTQKSYDNEFKAQAVKLAQEIGGHKAAKELGVPDGTIYCWIKAFKEGRLSANEAVHTPKTALSLNDELIELRKRVPYAEIVNQAREYIDSIGGFEKFAEWGLF